MSDLELKPSEGEKPSSEHTSRKGKEPNKALRFGLLALMGLLSLVLVAGAAGIIYAASLWNKVQRPVGESGDYTIPSELMNETDENGDNIVITLPVPTLPSETAPSETETSTEAETEPSTEASTEEETTKAETTEGETTEAETTTQAVTEPPAPPRETYSWESKIPTSWDIDPSVAQAMSQYYSFVVFGVDARNNTTITHGAQGDVVIIVSIHKTTKEVKLLSVYRDTLMAYTNLTNYGKITNVYRVNGADGTMTSMNYCFDLRMTNYVAVNWKALADVVNIMGGLDVSITAAEARIINQDSSGLSSITGVHVAAPIQVSDGVHHLDGIQVVAYCRIRKIGDDWGRTARQRNILNTMLARAKTMSLGELTAAANALFGEIGTNFSLAEVLSLLSDVRSYRIVDASAFPYQFNSDSTIYPRDLVYNVSQMHGYLFNNWSYTPSLAVYSMGQNFAALHAQHFGW